MMFFFIYLHFLHLFLDRLYIITIQELPSFDHACFRPRSFKRILILSPISKHLIHTSTFRYIFIVQLFNIHLNVKRRYMYLTVLICKFQLVFPNINWCWSECCSSVPPKVRYNDIDKHVWRDYRMQSTSIYENTLFVSFKINKFHFSDFWLISFSQTGDNLAINKVMRYIKESSPIC